LAALLGMLGSTGQVQAQFRYDQTGSIGSGGANTGTSPYNKLIEGPNGALFGTTRFRGSSLNRGTLYTVNKDGSGFRVLHVFGSQPDGGSPTYPGLTVGTNGLIYGVTDFGGTADSGTIYSIRPDGSGYHTIFSFTASTAIRPRGQLVIADDGSFIGTTLSGSIFRIDHDGANYRVLNYSLTNGPGSGGAYQAGVIKGSDGWLYGTTENGGTINPAPEFNDPWGDMGTIFRIRQDGGSYQLLHQFQGALFGDGAFPHGTLLQASDGLLYGMTVKGGSYLVQPPFDPSSLGTIFRINPDGSDYRVLHRFADVPDGGGGPYHELIEGSDGSLFGAASRGVFKIQRDGSGYTIVDTNETTGGLPIPGVIRASDGRLYRPIFSEVIGINEDGSGRQILGRFQDVPNEQIPRAPLLASGGRLFGTTEVGGTGSNGTIFVLSQDATSLKVITMLGTNAAAGKVPNGLAEGTNGFLYGTTQFGGSNNFGVIFRIDANGGVYTNLYHFGPASDGRAPRCGLVSGGDGFLYGCGFQGGNFGRGTIFRIREDGSGYTILRHLGATIPDGQSLQTALVTGPDGALYGVATGGGANSRGTIFRISRNGSEYTNLRHFAGGSDGANPQTPLLLASDGYFYGTTFSGGTGFGTIYRLRPDGTEYQVLYRLTERTRDGSQPRGPLVEKPSGVLWGCTTAGGAYNSGVIFRAQMDGFDYRPLWQFGADAQDGDTPAGGLTLAGADWVAGPTTLGGGLGMGSVFRFDPLVTVIRVEVADALVFLTWNGAGGELESVTDWIGGLPVWSAQPADISINGNETTAILPLEFNDRIFRVRKP
jgi:uncharacterized repeat protein (TIGR03803 family)